MANPSPTPPLTAERALFKRLYPQFLSEHRGEVVLIHGTEVLGFFKSLPSAEAAAYRQFNLHGKEFLMRQILEPNEENQEEVYQLLNLAELA